MSDLETPFQQHDLVWAKVQNYPWWPGKIAQIFQQKNSLIFKISFYADPTYCYLKEQALIPFEQFQQQLNFGFSIGSQLQKAISLANNAFQRKKQSIHKRRASQDNQTTLEKQVIQELSQMAQQQGSKVDDFQQSTVHVDEHLQISNRKLAKIQKSTQIKNLLASYKLDKIPNLPKTVESDMQQEKEDFEEDLIESQSSEQQNVQLFNVRNAKTRKSQCKKNKRKPMIKRKSIAKLTSQEKRIQLTKRICSILISKNIDSSISRHLTLKVIQKVDESLVHPSNPSTQTIQQTYTKLIKNLLSIDPSTEHQDKLLEVYNSVEMMFQLNPNQKQQEEKTNMIYSHGESLEALC